MPAESSGERAPSPPQPSAMPGVVASAAASKGRLCAVLLAVPGEAGLDLAVYAHTIATVDQCAGYAAACARAHEVRK